MKWSNLGTKITFPLTATPTNYIALPYDCKLNGKTISSGLAQADDLREELIAAGATRDGSTGATYYNGSLWKTWTGGGIGQVNFTITKGLGVGTVSGSTLNFTIMGEVLTPIPFTFTGSITSFIGLPYNAKVARANVMYTQIAALLPQGGSLSIYKFNGTGWWRYSGGGRGDVNFYIVSGDVMEVLASDTITWTPEVY